MTISGLGRALAEANDRLEVILREAHLYPPKWSRKPRANPDVFDFDPEWVNRLGRIGASLAGEHMRAVWTPMSVINERARENRPPPAPMPEEVKAHLKAIGKIKPHDNGDPAARLLRDCHTQDEVYAFTAKYCKVKESELRAKYEKLNPGQRRMCCGNRVRAMWKKLNPGEVK